MKTLFLAFLLIECGAVAFAQATRNEIALLTADNFTHRSPGNFVAGPSAQIRVHQSMDPGIGSAFEFRHWFRQNDAGSLTFAATPSKSRFWLPGGSLFAWPVSRYEFDLLWSHKLSVSRNARLLTYSMAGVGAVALWGGSGGGDKASGADRQFPLIGGAGGDIRLSKRLTFRAEATADIMRQSTFSDPTYRSNWTVMVCPKVGFVWALGKRPPESH